MRDDSQPAGSLRGSSVSFVHESGTSSGSLQVGGSSFGQHIDKFVGAPVGGGKPGAVALFGWLRLVRRYSQTSLPLETILGRSSSTAWAILLCLLARCRA